MAERRDEVGHTGVYPATGPLPEGEAEVLTPGRIAVLTPLDRSKGTYLFVARKVGDDFRAQIKSATDVLTFVASIFARALWQIGAGVVVGITVALVLHRRLNIEIEGGWHIPGILPAAAIFIMLIGLLSAAGPARRAVRVDPTEALRDGYD